MDIRIIEYIALEYRMFRNRDDKKGKKSSSIPLKKKKKRMKAFVFLSSNSIKQRATEYYASQPK